MRVRNGFIAMAVVLLVATACSGSTSNDTRALDSITVPDTVRVTSPDFANNGALPKAASCDGAGTAPTITWGAVPALTKSVAVVVDDPDAPNGKDYLQWLVVGLPPKSGSVPSRESGVSQLDNTGGTVGWAPLCPPVGSTHHYHFTVYALNDYVCADNGDASNGPGCSPPSSVQALRQISGTAIAKGTRVGTYSR